MYWGCADFLHVSVENFALGLTLFPPMWLTPSESIELGPPIESACFRCRLFGVVRNSPVVVVMLSHPDLNSAASEWVFRLVANACSTHVRDASKIYWCILQQPSNCVSRSITTTSQAMEFYSPAWRTEHTTCAQSWYCWGTAIPNFLICWASQGRRNPICE